MNADGIYNVTAATFHAPRRAPRIMFGIARTSEWLSRIGVSDKEMLARKAAPIMSSSSAASPVMIMRNNARPAHNHKRRQGNPRYHGIPG